MLLEAEGYYRLMLGETSTACQNLERAADARVEAYWKAHLRLEIAKVRADRELFLEVIDRFDAMGSVSAADRARSFARAIGLRPGRKHAAHRDLTEREYGIAMLVARGMTNREIAGHLHISLKAVEFHLGNVMTKRGLRSRVELAMRVADGDLLAANVPEGLSRT
jgi:DNA-binding NarL/FixJ family response regulator